MTARKPRHHHGNLRATLVAAGVVLVDRSGPDALSTRKLAAQAGVSHAAPAHHFPSLTHLRTAVAAEGFRRFTAAMEDAMGRADAHPRAQCDAACRGYIAFARAHPGLFHLIFGGLDLTPEDAEFCAASGQAAALLSRIAAPFAAGARDRAAVETMIWAQVHGFCSLMLSGQLAVADGIDPADWFLSLPGRAPVGSDAAHFPLARNGTAA
jgi:AcrR family transcriptional regulator